MDFFLDVGSLSWRSVTGRREGEREEELVEARTFLLRACISYIYSAGGTIQRWNTLPDAVNVIWLATCPLTDCIILTR